MVPHLSNSSWEIIPGSITICTGDVHVLSISDFETEKHTLLRHETSGFEARNLRDFET